MRILFFGASIERGYWDFSGGWVHIFQEDLDRYRWENDEDYSVYNLGISGDTSRGIRERIWPETEARNNSEELAFVLRVTGVNDSQVENETGENKVPPEEYEENLRQIIDTCREFSDRIFLVGSVPIIEEEVDPMPWKPTHSYLESEIEKYSERLRNVSEEKSVTLIKPDVEEEVDDWESCMKDGVHPGEEGHRAIYSIVKKRLKEEGLLPEDC